MDTRSFRAVAQDEAIVVAPTHAGVGLFGMGAWQRLAISAAAATVIAAAAWWALA